MKSGMMNTVFAAVVGGIVGAVVTMVVGGTFSRSEIPDSFEKLKVGELIVSQKMMLWEDGKEDADLLIQNGGMLAKTRVIATQISSNTVLANCVLTTPDHPTSRLDECEIFTEMGSSKTEGGMLTVRSHDGGNVLARQGGIPAGWAYTISYDNQANPICFFRRNDSGLRALGRFEVPQVANPEDGATTNAQQGGAPGQPLEVSQNLPTAPVVPQQTEMSLQGQNPGVEYNAMAPTSIPR